ncbi:hypothetical protein [Brevundimonas sp.]|uniref:hypothetical protein n=1 Tax=Brevundimonas sp. TaxID=1871086 RepID=UPI002CA784B4|nr:hypothetical protein [Brevundimonas sp.]HWQ88102.1 hypothetical protein [Brevundimonas sp.]
MLFALVMLISASPAAAMQSDPGDAVAVFQSTCLDSPGDRAAFEAWALAKGWPALRYPERPELHRDWITGFRSAQGEVRLSHFPARSEPEDADGVSRQSDEQIICSVEFRTDADSWRSSVSDLISRQNAPQPLDTSGYQGGPPGMVVSGWRLADDDTIHATYLPTPGVLELSFNHFPGR